MAHDRQDIRNAKNRVAPGDYDPNHKNALGSMLGPMEESRQRVKGDRLERNEARRIAETASSSFTRPPRSSAKKDNRPSKGGKFVETKQAKQVKESRNRKSQAEGAKGYPKTKSQQRASDKKTKARLSKEHSARQSAASRGAYGKALKEVAPQVAAELGLVAATAGAGAVLGGVIKGGKALYGLHKANQARKLVSGARKTVRTAKTVRQGGSKIVKQTGKAEAGTKNVGFTPKTIKRPTGKSEVPKVDVGAEKALARKASRRAKPKSEFGDTPPPKTGGGKVIQKSKAKPEVEKFNHGRPAGPGDTPHAGMRAKPPVQRVPRTLQGPRHPGVPGSRPPGTPWKGSVDQLKSQAKSAQAKIRGQGKALDIKAKAAAGKAKVKKEAIAGAKTGAKWGAAGPIMAAGSVARSLEKSKSKKKKKDKK